MKLAQPRAASCAAALAAYLPNLPGEYEAGRCNLERLVCLSVGKELGHLGAAYKECGAFKVVTTEL
jgi:hypothetical protein